MAIPIIKDNSQAVLARMRRFVGNAIEKTGDDMAQHMRDEMVAEKHGRFYGTHQASAEFEAPANWHDVLMNTIENERTGDISTLVSAGSDEAHYLKDYLENGSPGGRIAPRPLVAPALDIAAVALPQNVADAIKEALA